MNVKELKAALVNVDDDARVVDEDGTEFADTGINDDRNFFLVAGDVAQ